MTSFPLLAATVSQRARECPFHRSPYVQSQQKHRRRRTEPPLRPEAYHGRMQYLTTGDCRSLSEVTIHDGVRHIRNDAFHVLTSLYHDSFMTVLDTVQLS
jgi:hypothetical protein